MSRSESEVVWKHFSKGSVVSCRPEKRSLAVPTKLFI